MIKRKDNEGADVVLVHTGAVFNSYNVYPANTIPEKASSISMPSTLRGQSEVST